MSVDECGLVLICADEHLRDWKRLYPVIVVLGVGLGVGSASSGSYLGKK